jgi:hypothetical protein
VKMNAPSKRVDFIFSYSGAFIIAFKVKFISQDCHVIILYFFNVCVCVFFIVIRLKKHSINSLFYCVLLYNT